MILPNIAATQRKIKSDTLYLQDKLKTNLTAKGIIGLTTETMNQLVDKVPEIPSGGSGNPTNLWTRPLDRPVKPVMFDNMILILFGVSKNSPNDIAFTVICIGGYDVVGADGAVSNHASNTKAEFMYDFDNIDIPIDSQGYKMCWITIRPTLEIGNITSFDILQKHSLRPAAASLAVVSQTFEMYIQCPSLSNFSNSQSSTSYGIFYKLCDIFSLDINVLSSNQNYFLSGWSGLKLIEKLYVGRTVTVGNFLNGATSFDGIIPIESDVFSKATINCMNNATSYNRQFERPFTAITTSAFSGMNAYNHIIELDLANRTTVVGFAINLTALKGMRLYNMTDAQTSVNVSGSSLDIPALNLLGSDLYDRTGLTAGTLTVTNCFGAARWSAEDRALVQAKNWNIVG